MTSSILDILTKAGAANGRPVIAVTSSMAALEGLIHATAALDVPLFPLDPALPDKAIGALCDQAGGGPVVSDRGLPGREPIPPEICVWPEGASPPPSRRRPAGIALLMATSGSSGQPKAVMLRAGALAAAAQASLVVTPLKSGDRWLACLPLFHIGGYSILARCRPTGATAILHHGFDAERVWHGLTHEAVTHLSLVPTMLSRLIDFHSAPPPPRLRHVLVGGAALTLDLAARANDLGWPIQPTYGMSEMASQVATLPSLPRRWRPGQVGRPLPGVEAALTPDGRLKLRGPMMMAGYANPTLSPGDGLDEDGWFVTSDLAEIAEDGCLTILGRGDDVIVSGGKKIMPGMVEEALASCPGLDAVAVLGRPDPEWGAVVAVAFAGALSPRQLLDWCRKNVSSPLRPRRAIKLDALPLLVNGKTDRVALRHLIAGEHP